MTRAETLRAQMATSTDQDWLEREALRADLVEAKRHLDKLTSFYIDNVMWGRAAEAARAWSMAHPVSDGESDLGFTGVSG